MGFLSIYKGMIKKCLSLLRKLFMPFGLLWVIFYLNPTSLSAWQKTFSAADSFDPASRGASSIRIVFYNVENLFDYFDDSTTIDEQYLPYQGNYWTKQRYHNKQQKLAKTIMAMGGWEAPGIVGLCEVENRYVLNSLTRFTPLQKTNYQIIHKDSPDRRGIDVALLYRSEKFEVIDYEFYRVSFPFDPESKTRDVLHAYGRLPNKDTLHVFVNHWPSKFGGEFETEPKRMFVAQMLRQKVDSIWKQYPEANILIMGDLNDEPDAKSVKEGLSTSDMNTQPEHRKLYNLMEEFQYVTGTHSFQNRWSVLDQFILSGGLLQTEQSTSLKERSLKIFDQPYLIMTGSTGATRPFRTYQGPQYLGGYSDHLPILLDLTLR